MLNNQLVTLEKYQPIINYLNHSRIPKKGWHCHLELDREHIIHIFGANTPQIAITLALSLLEQKKFGHFIITDTGNIKEI